MSSYKVVKVVREVMKYTLYQGKSEYNNQELIENLSKKGIKQSDIEHCLNKLNVSDSLNRKWSLPVVYRQFSESENRYFGSDLKSFILILMHNNVLNRAESEEFINFLLAMANTKISLKETRPLIIEFFNQGQYKSRLLLVLSQLDCCRQKIKIH